MATVGQGKFDEGVGGRLDALVCGHQRRDLFTGYLREEAVGADEKPVAFVGSVQGAVELNLWCDTERSGEYAAVRMVPCFLFSELPATYGLGGHAVVVRQLHQRAIPQQVGTAVAHVDDHKSSVFNEPSRTDRRPHAL